MLREIAVEPWVVVRRGSWIGTGGPLLLASVYGPALVVLAMLVAFVELVWGGAGYGLLTRDPLSVVADPALRPDPVRFYVGFLSNLGVLLWAITAGGTLLAFAVLRDEGDVRLARFFGFAGLFTTFLMIDDVYMLHEINGTNSGGRVREILQRFPPSAVFKAAYAVGMVVLLWGWRKVILGQTRWSLLLVSLGMFALSMGWDELVDQRLAPGTLLSVKITVDRSFFLEDATKFLGIAGWLGYFGLSSFEALRRR
ncbi:hypothetical protein AB1L88_02750 [Tautonia sp. JC769]|uniref:hypothetical protein n=1 Tax=Tautonia sp. JC769 TaxID=3232135 RepID=UPI0034594BFE